MGERIYGYHAIEEGLKKARSGSTLYVERGGSERLRRLIFQAECTGKVAVKKVSRDELEKMCPGVDLRGALLDLGGPRTGASRLIERSVDEFLSSLKEEDGALVLILDGITDPQHGAQELQAVSDALALLPFRGIFPRAAQRRPNGKDNADLGQRETAPDGIDADVHLSGPRGGRQGVGGK